MNIRCTFFAIVFCSLSFAFGAANYCSIFSHVFSVKIVIAKMNTVVYNATLLHGMFVLVLVLLLLLLKP